MRDGRIESSLAVSTTLEKLPVVIVDYVFTDRSIFPEADEWLKRHRTDHRGRYYTGGVTMDKYQRAAIIFS